MTTIAAWVLVTLGAGYAPTYSPLFADEVSCLQFRQELNERTQINGTAKCIMIKVAK